jgi:HPt (histidine-containing phosphotransfer) domain-containing protein
MRGAAPERGSVSTYQDHDVIRPPNKLAKVVSHVSIVMPEDDPVARAEEALAQLSSEFGGWMITECERLDAGRRAVHAEGIGKKTISELFHAAHDLKGDAATFGYPAVALAADSLCRVLEHTPDPTKIPLTLIDKHVDAVRAIVREYARPDIDEIATELTRKLREVTDEFLAHENRHRPEYLQGVLAPPLSPEAF